MDTSGSDRRPMLPRIPLGLLFAFLAVLVCATGASMWAATSRADVGWAPVLVAASPPTTPPRHTVPVVTSPVPPAMPTTTVVTPAPAPRTAAPAPRSGCPTALQYLAANAAPGFQLVCPGNAQGHQGPTCLDLAPCAPGQHMIVIADPCPAAYMNEAHNSWVLLHQTSGAPIPGGQADIDPFGHC